MQLTLLMPVWTKEECGSPQLHYLVPDAAGHLTTGGCTSYAAGRGCEGCDLLLEEMKRRKREYH